MNSLPQLEQIPTLEQIRDLQSQRDRLRAKIEDLPGKVESRRPGGTPASYRAGWVAACAELRKIIEEAVNR